MAGHIKDEAVRSFFILRTELFEEHGCVGVIVPTAHRAKLLSNLHAEHLGICHMKGPMCGGPTWKVTLRKQHRTVEPVNQ